MFIGTQVQTKCSVMTFYYSDALLDSFCVHCVLFSPKNSAWHISNDLRSKNFIWNTRSSHVVVMQ